MLKLLKRLSARTELGFTLIELLVVVIIIGLLAAIALPIFLNQQRAAVDASVKSDVRNTVTDVNGWLLSHHGVAAANTGEYTSAANGGRVTKSSDKTTLGVQIAASGTYTICGFNTGGSNYTVAEKAWGFDSATGKFSLTTSGTCAGAVDGAGNDISTTPVCPIITTVLLPDGKQNEAYTAPKLTATGNPAPKFSGSGVAGLAVAADGTISGAPTGYGSVTLTVNAKNFACPTVSKDFTFNVAQQYVTPHISDTDPNYLGNAVVGQNYAAKAIHEVSMNGVNDPTKFNCHLQNATATTMPTGMSGFGYTNNGVGFNAYTGTDSCLLTGTPNALTNTPIVYPLTVRLYNVKKPSLYDEKTYNLTLRTYPRYALTNKSDTVALNAGSAITGYNAAVNYKDADSATNYQIVVTSYPAGASQSVFAVNSSGQIAGTPTVAGAYKFDVLATNAYPGSDTKSYTVNVAAAVQTGTVPLTDFESGQNTSATTPFSVTYTNKDPNSGGIVVTTEQAHAGTHSLKSNPSSGGYTYNGWITVTVTGATVGKSYALSGYYKTANNSGNTGSYTAETRSYSGFSTASSQCPSYDYSKTSTGVAKNTWNSFLGKSCTATSSTLVFYVLVGPGIPGYSSNGVYYDDMKLTIS